jgi:chromosome partitioning protein
MSIALDRTHLRRTIVITNGKGGVGKTSTVSHLAALLALGGYRCLILDLDRQSDLGDDLGYNGRELGDDGLELSQAVSAGRAFEPLRNVRQNLDVVPGGFYLDDLAATLDSRRRRDGENAMLALAQSLALTVEREKYDFVLMDTPPGTAILQEAALAGGRWLVIPYKSDASSRRGLREVAKRFKAAMLLNPDLRLLAVFLFGTGKAATRVQARAQAGIREDLGEDAPILEAKVQHLEAPAQDVRERGQLAHELERDVADGPPWYERLRNGGTSSEVPASTAGTLAEDYRRLAEELFKRLVAAEQQAVQA